MSDYDDTNRGALFGTADKELIRMGQVHFNQEPVDVAIIKVKTRNGKTVYKVFQDIGAVFPNTDKNSENSPDMSGNVTFENAEWRMAGWKKTSREGLNYTSVALTPPDDHYGGGSNDEGGGSPGADLDDEIPF